LHYVRNYLRVELQLPTDNLCQWRGWHNVGRRDTRSDGDRAGRMVSVSYEWVGQ
jgi:hypothetical protein